MTERYSNNLGHKAIMEYIPAEWSYSCALITSECWKVEVYRDDLSLMSTRYNKKESAYRVFNNWVGLFSCLAEQDGN